MKRVFAICVAAAFVIALTSTAFAERVKGTVAKIDVVAKSVTIQPKEGDAVTVIMEDADQLSKVKEGEKGQATYDVKDGKNVGTKLKKMTAGCS
jgi:Cu/Ag efflux protein CusF